MAARTEEWRQNGDVSDAVADEILALLQGDLKIWRPILYVIPKAAIQNSRVHLVPLAQRAGMGDEFQIRDLNGAEFERIEFDGL